MEKTDFAKKTDRLMDHAHGCRNCKRTTKIMGVTVCFDCGLALTTQSNHETSERGNFANQNENDNTVCKGLPSNPHDVEISYQNNDLLPSSSKNKSTVASPEEGFKTIATMCDSLKLGPTVRNRANDNYLKVKGKRTTKGRKDNALLAACIDIAGQQEGDKRTLKEICSVFVGITLKELAQAKKCIKEEYKEMGEEMVMKPVSHAQCIRRYCSRLGMEERVIKAAEEAIEKSEEIDTRRNRLTVAGVIISMVTQLSYDNKIPLKDISRAVDVGQETIRSAYKEISPYASRLIPTWFANEGDLRKLTCPSTTDTRAVTRQNRYYRNRWWMQAT